MSLTQKHAELAQQQNTVDAVFNQMESRQATLAIQNSGQNMMPGVLSNGQYNSSGAWANYLLGDVTPMDEGVLK